MIFSRDFQSKMLESPTSVNTAVNVNSNATTNHHQQMAKRIGNGDFAEDYFASLSGPAKRLIEVSKIFSFLQVFLDYSRFRLLFRLLQSLWFSIFCRKSIFNFFVQNGKPFNKVTENAFFYAGHLLSRAVNFLGFQCHACMASKKVYFGKIGKTNICRML